MTKFNVELPIYRLQLHLKLIKRRKPLLAEPILPTPEMVNKKYRTGTFLGKLGRYLSEHRNIRKYVVGNFAVVAILASFSQQTRNIQAEGSIDPIIEAQTPLTTERGMQYPVGNVKINQGYGFFHPAVDLGGIKGDSIKPIMAGVVAFAGWDRTGYGNLVILAHKNGIESYYAHLSKIEVKTGQPVDVNTEIGKMGATGHATGVHLHLEIHQNGITLNPLNLLTR